MSLSLVFTQKAQAKTKMDPMVGLFTTIVVNNVLNTCILTIRYLVWEPVPINFTAVSLLVCGGIFGSVFGRGCIFAAIAILGAARAGLTKATMPIFSILGGILLLGERLGPLAWLGISVILFGLFLMSYDSVRRADKKRSISSNEAPQISRLSLFKGIAFGLGSAFFLAGGNVFRRPSIIMMPDPFLALSIGSFSALLALIVILLIQGKGKAMLASVRNIEFNYAISGVFSSAAIFTMLMSLRFVPVSISNSISSIEPLFTILFAWLLKEGKKEKLEIRTILFGVIMVIGTIILMTK